jgi:hypothetical protein
VIAQRSSAQTLNTEASVMYDVRSDMVDCLDNWTLSQYYLIVK